MPRELTACPLCGHQGPFYVYNPAPAACHAYEEMPSGSRLDQCLACMFIFLNPQPTPEESLIYEAADEVWYPTEDLSPEEWEKSRRDARFALDFVTRFHPWRGRLLDVGSNRGFLMDAARQAGYETCGIEPTARTAEFSRRQFGADVFIGLIEDNSYPSASFDLITMLHVLEHIPALRPFLCATVDLLRPGGLLFLVVPYLDFFPRPVHFNYFGCDVLLRLLRDVGLSVISAEVDAGNSLFIVAKRADSHEELPSDSDTRLWDAFALHHAGAQVLERNIVARFEAAEARLADQEARLTEREARLAALEAH